MTNIDGDAGPAWVADANQIAAKLNELMKYLD